MFLILNRLRGTQGLWSKIIGLLLAVIIQIMFNNPYVSVAVGLGYIIGESFGWGLWVGTLTEHRESGYKLHDEGEGRSNGIEWLTAHIIKPTQKTWIGYCRLALTIRGLYWWLPTLAPLYFVGFSVVSIAVAVAVLSIGFPIACEVGYKFNDKIKFNKYGLSIEGGWEIQEAAYGVIQDVVLIGLILSYWIGA